MLKISEIIPFNRYPRQGFGQRRSYTVGCHGNAVLNPINVKLTFRREPKLNIESVNTFLTATLYHKARERPAVSAIITANK